METVILVSVLSTLGVVATLIYIVVTFIKLNNKVDDLEKNTHNEFGRVYDYIKEEIRNDSRNHNSSIESLSNNINNDFDRIRRDNNDQIQEIYRFVDSRCDKLDSKIIKPPQILTD